MAKKKAANEKAENKESAPRKKKAAVKKQATGKQAADAPQESKQERTDYWTGRSNFGPPGFKH